MTYKPFKFQWKRFMQAQKRAEVRKILNYRMLLKAA
tara:strand:- start:1045 stop:1152 length:108 start_codon:yes stop_codon:yes gene_type:complete